MGHPGRDSTLAILSRSYYWPQMSKMVRRFCRNCDICGRAHVWRSRKQGLLQPLPIPDRYHSELSIDFMTDLPAKKEGDPKFMMVIVDRLAKTVTLEAMKSMTAEECAERFIQCHFRFHGFPSALTSDRGSNWISRFWTQLCKILKIEQRLSTSHHPQTDGATERMNQEVLSYLRAYVTYAQFDWVKLLPGAMLAINNRDTSLGVSPFFLTHGYHVDPVPTIDNRKSTKTPEGRAKNFINRLQEGTEFAQAAMASTQQRMEEYANRSRRPAESFRTGDHVWLNLKNIETPQLSKKLSWMHGKYRVIGTPSANVVTLDVPTGIFPKFHVDLLKRAHDDPLPSQVRDDPQPPPLIPANEDGDALWEIEKILRAEKHRRGRGFVRRVLVKWKGYQAPTWEPRNELQGKDALKEFIAMYGTRDGVGEDIGANIGRTGKREKKKKIKCSLAINEEGNVTGCA